jgi:hypothetical protein
MIAGATSVNNFSRKNVAVFPNSVIGIPFRGKPHRPRNL